MATHDLVLLTGCSGFIGFRTLRYALEHGRRVRAVVRSESKAQMVRKTLAARNFDASSARLEFVVVPEFVAEGAFERAMKGVTGVIHVASPIPIEVPEDGNLHRQYVEFAVKGTLAILAAAQTAGTVRRVVVTSSIAAIVPPPVLFGPQPLEHTISPTDRLPELQPPHPNIVVAYTASKIAALNRSEAWMEEHRPGFDLISILPSFVLGRDDLCTSTSAFQASTTRFPVNLALGRPDLEGITQMPNAFNSVDDCAMVHVRALEPAVSGNQALIVSNSGVEEETWADLREMVRRRYPGPAAGGRFPNNGTLTTQMLRIDQGATERGFGFRHASFEEAAAGSLDHYLRVLAWEKGGQVGQMCL